MVTRAATLRAAVVVLSGAVGCDAILNIPNGTLSAASGMDAGSVFPDKSGDGAPTAPARESGADTNLSDDSGSEWPGDAAGGGPGCASEADHLYALGPGTYQQTLYTLDPPGFTPVMVATLSCDPYAPPISFTVSRGGIIWIVYDDGNLFQVNPANGMCTATDFAPGQHSFDKALGIGFSSDAQGSASETLYACASQGLAIIDTGSLLLTPVGTIPGLDVSEGGCVLSGTHDGQLFALAPVGNVGFTAAKLDKGTSAPVWTKVVDPPVPGTFQGYGLAAWDRDLIFFAQNAQRDNTWGAWSYDPSDQMFELRSDNVGIQLQVMGQSTCAP